MQFRLIPDAGHCDVLLLHLAKQSLDPSLQLAFQFGAVDDEDDRRVGEPRLVLEDLTGGGKQRKGLPGTLGVPDQTACFGGVGAAI